jgi:hypothetical protein
MATFKKFIAKIEAENELFNSMSKAEKRVRIAEDCIERIKLKMFEPNEGVFIGYDTTMVLQTKENLKEMVNTSIQCSACAKGGLFLTYVGRVNKFKSCDIYGSNDSSNREHRKLLEIFTMNQLALIEFAFEGSQHIWGNLNGEAIKFTDLMEMKIIEFYEKYKDSTDRMIAICENIIKNKGIFKI